MASCWEHCIKPFGSTKTDNIFTRWRNSQLIKKAPEPWTWWVVFKRTIINKKLNYEYFKNKKGNVKCN
jgi:hypothetical protein